MVLVFTIPSCSFFSPGGRAIFNRILLPLAWRTQEERLGISWENFCGNDGAEALSLGGSEVRFSNFSSVGTVPQPRPLEQWHKGLKHIRSLKQTENMALEEGPNS